MFTTDRGNGVYEVRYTPFFTGEDEIRIRLNGEHIDGSPFESRVRN